MDEEINEYPYYWGGHGFEIKQSSKELVENVEVNLEEQSDYCPICNSCGEDGCCSIENTIIAHGCKYAEAYARDVFFNKMLLDSLLILFKTSYKLDNTIVESIIDKAYDEAFEKMEKKYGNEA